MEDIDILNKFDNDKLIDVVKNYKRYGYDDELRDYAINLLGMCMKKEKIKDNTKVYPIMYPIFQ